MADTENIPQKKLPKRRPWLRATACVLVAVTLLSLMLDAVRIKLGRDAKTETEKAGAAALAANSEYMDASTPERLAQWFSSAIRSPETYEDYYQIATILIAQQEYARALKNISASIRLYDGNEQAVFDELYMKQGSLYAMLGDYDAMENSFLHVSEESAYHPQKLLLIAQAALEREDAQKGIEYLTQYAAVMPDDVEALSVLGQLCVLAEDYERAAGAYGRMIDTNGDADGSLHFLRASCYLELQEYALALADFQKAEELEYADASLVDAQCALTSFLCGAYEDCIRYGETALADPSESVSQPDLLYYMGVSALSLSKFEASYDYFSRLLALDAENLDAEYYATVSLMALERQQEAVTRFTGLIDKGYSLSLCHYNRAVCYISMKRYGLARADLERVVEINDDAELVTTAQALLGQM